MKEQKKEQKSKFSPACEFLSREVGALILKRSLMLALMLNRGGGIMAS